MHVHACACQVGSRETSLASLTVSVAQSKLTSRSLVLAPVVLFALRYSDAIPASLNLARTAFAAISEVDQPGVQTAIFSGVARSGNQAFQNDFRGELIDDAFGGKPA